MGCESFREVKELALDCVLTDDDDIKYTFSRRRVNPGLYMFQLIGVTPSGHQFHKKKKCSSLSSEAKKLIITFLEFIEKTPTESYNLQ